MSSMDLILALIAGFALGWLSRKLLISHGDNSNSWKSTAKQFEEVARKFEQEMLEYKRMAISLSEERFFNPEAKLIETDKRKLN